MHRLTVSIVTLLLLIGLSSCQRGGTAVVADATPYCEDSAMAHFLVEPEHALTLLDSAVTVGTLTPQRADYLKAIVAYNAQNDLEAALGYCQQLIDDEAWKALPDSEDVVSFRVDVYRLMATICSNTGKLMPAVRYAQLGAGLAHGNKKLLGDEIDFMSRIGHVMSQTGQYDDALEALYRAEALAREDNTWSSLLSYLNNSKKLYSTLASMGRYDEAKRVVNTSLHRLEALTEHIDEVQYTPAALADDPQALEEFIEYNQVPYGCYMVNIYAQQQQTDSALYWLERLQHNRHAGNPALTSSLIPPLIRLGRYDEAEAMIATLRASYGADTLNHTYLETIGQCRQLAACRGNYRQAYQWADEAIGLSNRLKETQLQMLLADATAEYHLQDERQRRKDAEERLLWILNGILVLCALAAAIVAYIYISKLLARMRLLRRQYEETRQELDDVSATKQPADTHQADNIESIYRQAQDLMEQQQLYRESALDINTLSQMLMTNRHYLSQAINNQSGMNFRTWLATYRIEYAKHLLLERPKISGEKLALECGFDNRISLYRQFKNIVGMTITEWVERNATAQEQEERE